MLPRGFLLKCLAAARLKPAQRQLLVEHLVLGSPDWQTLQSINPPPELLPSLDPVVLALRRVLSGDGTGLRAMHRFAMETAAEREHGFLQLVIAEAIAAPDHLPGSAELRPLPLHVCFALIDVCLDPSDPTRSALLARALAEAARRLILKKDIFWRSVLVIAFSERSQAPPDRELDATLFETLALGRELQGRYTDADQAFVAALIALEEASLPGRYLETMAQHAEFLRRSGLTKLGPWSRCPAAG